MKRKPNILFLMTDHTNAQAFAPGSPCLTPHVDALASDGIQFGRCYTPNAICSPARASLMTSLYPSTHGMWCCTHTQPKGWVDVPADRFTYFSRRLADAGYKNGYFGKWHWAEGRLDGSELVVSSKDVKEPVAVRYAYTTQPIGCNLYNKEGLPAAPFTTCGY